MSANAWDEMLPHPQEILDAVNPPAELVHLLKDFAGAVFCGRGPVLRKEVSRVSQTTCHDCLAAHRVWLKELREGDS